MARQSLPRSSPADTEHLELRLRLADVKIRALLKRVENPPVTALRYLVALARADEEVDHSAEISAVEEFTARLES